MSQCGLSLPLAAPQAHSISAGQKWSRVKQISSLRFCTKWSSDGVWVHCVNCAYLSVCVCVCGHVYDTAHMWRSETTLRMLSITFHLYKAFYLIFIHGYDVFRYNPPLLIPSNSSPSSLFFFLSTSVSLFKYNTYCVHLMLSN